MKFSPLYAVLAVASIVAAIVIENARRRTEADAVKATTEFVLAQSRALSANMAEIEARASMLRSILK